MKLLESYKGKSVLVTGGLGMIGSFAATKAADMGASVKVMDCLLPHHGGNLFNLKGYEDSIEIMNGDIRDREKMKQVVEGVDLIVHCAAHVVYPHSMSDPFLDLEINGFGHLSVLEACRHVNPGARVVFTSSRMKYGNISELPVNENHPANPLVIYGAHKLLGENYQNIYHKHFGIEYTNVVIPNPYGPRQHMQHHHYGLVNWFIRQCMENNPISIFGDGLQLRDYIYVEDIVTAILLAGASDSTVGETLNLGNEKGITFKYMVETVVGTVGQGSYEHVDWPDNYKAIETGGYVADISKARSLGYEPAFTFEEGVARTHEFYKSNWKNYW
ncbi:NAD-dependent epimerase/dehydratase family protein [Granulosicoccus sp. 3-233]|uniref:NAD-dependent epimerase/dehydratase family protein n=1 Tax=Granulosicoccus sp. 3-233 TaxID=3417969 RepID=UPI003D345707